MVPSGDVKSKGNRMSLLYGVASVQEIEGVVDSLLRGSAHGGKDIVHAL